MADSILGLGRDCAGWPWNIRMFQKVRKIPKNYGILTVDQKN